MKSNRALQICEVSKFLCCAWSDYFSDSFEGAGFGVFVPASVFSLFLSGIGVPGVALKLVAPPNRPAMMNPLRRILERLLPK